MGEKNNIPSIFLRFLAEALCNKTQVNRRETNKFNNRDRFFLYLWFCFLLFQLPKVSCNLKILDRTFQKQVIHKFLLCTTLSSVRTSHESCSVLSRTGISPCPEHPTIRDTGALGYHISFRSLRGLTLTGSLFYLIITQMCMDMDAGNLFMPKRSHKVLALSEKCESKKIIG